jgi:hypothetical protein
MILNHWRHGRQGNHTTNHGRCAKRSKAGSSTVTNIDSKVFGTATSAYFERYTDKIRLIPQLTIVAEI